MWSFAYFLETDKLIELPLKVIANPQNYCIRLMGYWMKIPKKVVKFPITIYCNIAAETFSLNGKWCKAIGAVNESDVKTGKAVHHVPCPTLRELEITGGVCDGMRVYCDQAITTGVIYIDIVPKSWI